MAADRQWSLRSEQIMIHAIKGSWVFLGLSDSEEFNGSFCPRSYFDSVELGTRRRRFSFKVKQCLGACFFKLLRLFSKS